MAFINPIPAVIRVGADPRVCPDRGSGHVTSGEFPHPVGANTSVRPYGVATTLESTAPINPIPAVTPVGADPRVCPDLRIGPVTSGEFPHGGHGNNIEAQA